MNLTDDKFKFDRRIKALLDAPALGEDGNPGELANGVTLTRLIERSEQITDEAFRQEDHEALECAHRTLFTLYGDRVWNAPSAPRDDATRDALTTIRQNLEKGFREYLAKRRLDVDLDPVNPGAIGSPAAWFEKLALGEHPYEDPEWTEFMRHEIKLDQMREIVAQRSLFFLREPDPWVYVVPTLTGIAKAGLIDLLLDEYGWGKLERMHSSIYGVLMDALGLDSSIDFYEETTSWQYLATLNHQWMYSLTPEFSRRLVGTIYLTEADSPGAMTNYLTAWQRLGIDDKRVLEFYELHVEADENHRDVALSEVAVPVAELEPTAAAEIAIGIFDGRTLEAEFATHLLSSFRAGESSLKNGSIQELVA